MSTTPTDQLSADQRRTQFIFVASLLEVQQHADVLFAVYKERKSDKKPFEQFETVLFDAVFSGAYALLKEANHFAKTARDLGQLLYCFEGTTVLEGCAA